MTPSSGRVDVLFSVGKDQRRIREDIGEQAFRADEGRWLGFDCWCARSWALFQERSLYGRLRTMGIEAIPEPTSFAILTGMDPVAELSACDVSGGKRLVQPIASQITQATFESSHREHHMSDAADTRTCEPEEHEN